MASRSALSEDAIEKHSAFILMMEKLKQYTKSIIIIAEELE